MGPTNLSRECGQVHKVAAAPSTEWRSSWDLDRRMEPSLWAVHKLQVSTGHGWGRDHPPSGHTSTSGVPPLHASRATDDRGCTGVSPHCRHACLLPKDSPARAAPCGPWCCTLGPMILHSQKCPAVYDKGPLLLWEPGDFLPNNDPAPIHRGQYQEVKSFSQHLD